MNLKEKKLTGRIEEGKNTGAASKMGGGKTNPNLSITGSALKKEILEEKRMSLRLRKEGSGDPGPGGTVTIKT